MFKPDNRTIHFFDLDNTLWRTGNRVWLIDKERPHEPLFRLEPREVNKIVNNLYKKDGVHIEYNESTYHVSKELFDKANKKRKLMPDRLGLSWIEYSDEQYISNCEVKFLLGNITHLEGTTDPVCLLTGRAHLDRHDILLGKLKEKLSDLGITVWKSYFVSDKMHEKHDLGISIRKSIILLEHLTGLKIKDGKFVPVMQDWFTDVAFYDDEYMNIDHANNLQGLLEDTLSNTQDTQVRQIVMQRLHDHQLRITTNMVSNNELNRFSTTVTTLHKPLTYGGK